MKCSSSNTSVKLEKKNNCPVKRVRILLFFVDGLNIPKIAELVNVTTPKFNRCVDKALKQGAAAVLHKEQRSDQPSKNAPKG
ncbi:hypothetical protein J41TS4_42450 [Paenibacillus apis]|uniref:Uncharacterized protein n=1 Tax=Paenibacillus apis TaxID=1792174 RepID=A0A920CPQ5_9BACL|nr:hypothetical protein J41TS4_42450 [Paenibacillus apis]